MNQVNNIINLFSDFYYVSDIEFAKIQGEQLGRLISATVKNIEALYRCIRQVIPPLNWLDQLIEGLVTLRIRQNNRNEGLNASKLVCINVSK